MSHPVIARYYRAPVNEGDPVRQGTFVGRTLRQCMAQAPEHMVCRVTQGSKYLGPLYRYGKVIEETTDGHYH